MFDKPQLLDGSAFANPAPPESDVDRAKQAPELLNPFDPASLRLSQDFAGAIGVRKVVTTIPCRKPNRHEFVRVRPGPDWRLETAVFDDKIHRETYLVAPKLCRELAGEVSPVCLFVATTRQGDVFFWPCKLPGADGRANAWTESALAAARRAEKQWVRIAANMPSGMYDVFEAAAELSEPAWPDICLSEMLRLCFKDRFIDTIDHPVIRSLWGLA